MIASVSLAACAGFEGEAAPFSIVPGHASVAPGGTVRFSAPGNTVRWGIAERRAAPAATAKPSFPLRVGPDGRYLTDQQGRPWRVQADAAWLLTTVATPAEVERYLDVRRDQGFNAFYLMAMVHPGGYDAAPGAPDDLEGNPPFATAGDFSTAGASDASERYWRWVDWIVRQAERRGMVVMLAYTYLGWGGGDMGWYREVLAQPSQRALFDWGRWLGTRYREAGNVIWFALGDFTPPAGSEGALRTRAIIEGIKAAGAPQLFIGEGDPPDTLPAEVPDFRDLIDQNSFYGFGPDGRGAVYITADAAWRVEPAKPAWMEEGTYEFENNTGHFSREPWETRRGRFWSVLAGGVAGDGFGSAPVWQWSDASDTLFTPGARYSRYAFDLFAAIPWWTLRPSGTDPGFAGATLVTEGGGTWGELDYVTSALTADRRWLLAYVPVTASGARTISVDMATLAGPVRARWFDPATGAYLAASAGYEYRSAGTRSFTTPGSRRDGTDDWLLVLDATGEPTCGTISRDGTYRAPAVPPDGVVCEVTASSVADPEQIERAPVRFGAERSAR